MSTAFHGTRILVTGGSMGIGLEISQQLARRGARVIIAARGVDALEAALTQLEGAGHRSLRLDVSDEAAWRGAIEEIDAGGPLHGLVTAAGILGPIGPLDDAPPYELIRTIAVNLIGTMLALHYALPRLRATSGRAVTLSGGGGTSPLPRYDAYAASKAAVIRLTENVAANGGIDVNCVAPGFIATRMHEGTLQAGRDAAGAEYYERTRAQLVEGGFPATEAAELACFLLSADAHDINGRLLSAQWDPWRDEEFRARLRADPSLATLRRIDEQFFTRVGPRERPEPETTHEARLRTTLPEVDATRHSERYFDAVVGLARAIDARQVDAMARGLAALRKRGGRLFILGVGGGAGHASHAVNDFRKLCLIESYAPTDNVSELTARTNDDGWDTSFTEWLAVSKLSRQDALLVFSVGGGSREHHVSVNLVNAIERAREVGAAIYGVVGSADGTLAQLADVAIVIQAPEGLKTPLVESFQAVVWHALVSHPDLAARQGHWESLAAH